MKVWFSSPKNLFTLLAVCAVLASAGGLYLGITLALPAGTVIAALSVAGMFLWSQAWGEFLDMCLRLRRGKSAFSPETGRTLRVIGRCMVGLAAVTAACALTGGSRSHIGYWLIERIGLPGLFLMVWIVAKILQGLLEHAMAVEAEQEGVV